jgi:hypothetical protein
MTQIARFKLNDNYLETFLGATGGACRLGHKTEEVSKLVFVCRAKVPRGDQSKLSG